MNVTRIVAVILSTLAELNEPCPAGTLYAGLMSEVGITELIAILGAMRLIGYIEHSNNLVTLTAEGRARGNEINAALARQKAHLDDTCTQFPTNAN